MKIFLIADTHYCHQKLIEKNYRPDNFEKLLYKNLSNIPKDAVLLHLGDVCLGNDQEAHNKYIKTLKCQKWLVRGNHDHKSNNWYLNNGWNFICTSFVDRYFGRKILFSHIPKILHKNIDLNIHGHFHNSDHRWQEPELVKRITEKHRLFSAETSKYKPILLEDFIIKNYDHSKKIKKLFIYNGVSKIQKKTLS